MSSRFCTAGVAFLNWGWYTASPKEVVDSVRAFNGGRPGEVTVALYDVEDFFPSVDLGLLQEVVQRMVQELREKDNTMRYF